VLRSGVGERTKEKEVLSKEAITWQCFILQARPEKKVCPTPTKTTCGKQSPVWVVRLMVRHKKTNFIKKEDRMINVLHLFGNSEEKEICCKNCGRKMDYLNKNTGKIFAHKVLKDESDYEILLKDPNSFACNRSMVTIYGVIR